MRNFFLNCFFSALIAISASAARAGITDDMRYFLNAFSKQSCMSSIAKWYKQNHEILIIILGPQIIRDGNIRATNSKQQQFINLASMNKNKISANHAKNIITMLDYRRNNICRVNLAKVSDPLMKDIMKSFDQARANLIDRISSGRAKYSDVTKLLNDENANYEDIFVYWLENDPDGLTKLAGELQGFTNSFQNLFDTMLRTMEQHYDIR